MFICELLKTWALTDYKGFYIFEASSDFKFFQLFYFQNFIKTNQMIITGKKQIKTRKLN